MNNDQNKQINNSAEGFDNQTVDLNNFESTFSLEKQAASEASSYGERQSAESKGDTDEQSSAETASDDSFASDKSTAASEDSSKTISARRRRADKIITMCLVVEVCLLVAALLLKLFVVCPVKIEETSMTPNFANGQTVWVNKLASPKRGDVVVFYVNGDVNVWQELTESSQKGGKAQKYIKRIVALEGDSLWVEESDGDYILVIKTSDGQILRENYYTVGGSTAHFFDKNGNLTDVPTLGSDKLGNLEGTDEQHPYIVAEGCFYALGDNRHHSNDCRALGSMPLSRIFGIVID